MLGLIENSILKGQRGANLEIESKHIQDGDGKLVSKIKIL